MTLLERQLLVVQKLRSSMPDVDRTYFYLSETLNIKAHLRNTKEQFNGK